MRLIFENSRQVGADPVNHFIYLWRHGAIDRYVGKGRNGRWAAHTRPNPDHPEDRNEPKSRYFLAHLAETSCFILAEGLRTDEANERETVEIRFRGYLANGTGTLLSAWRGSFVAPKPRAAQRPAPTWKETHAAKRLRCEAAYARARALGLSEAEVRSAGTGMHANSLRGKIAHALCALGPGRYGRAAVMREGDVGTV
jgi:hypothetical protein